MIKVKNIVLGFREKLLLNDFSCEVPSGNITAIIGRNGVGKSTLLAALAGDIQVLSGEIYLDSQPITKYSKRELASIRSVAAQSHQYWMAYSAENIIQLGYEKVSAARFNHLLEKLDIEEFKSQSVTTLSGGQLQRIEIARAFMNEAPLVMLDEPFASQDIESIERLKDFILAEKKSGRTIVVVAHASADELKWCDQIIDLNIR